MPLIAPVVAPPPVVAAPLPPVPLGPPQLSPHVLWTPNGGAPVVLSKTVNTGIMMAKGGVLGLDMPPESQFETELAVGDGSVFHHRRALPREVTVPMMVLGDTLAEFEGYRRDLMYLFDPRRGEGRFTWAVPDNGTTRTLRCRYASGLDTSDTGRTGGTQYTQVYAVVLRAQDPYWYGDTVTVTFDVGTGSPFLPGPPFSISESTTTGEQTVVIDGEVDTFPEWVIHGPATGATLANLDTGKTLDLTLSLTSGQWLRVRTDPRVVAAQKFTNQAGQNVWSTVAGQYPELWPLRRGDNRVNILLSGGGVGSKIELIYAPRYLSA